MAFSRWVMRTLLLILLVIGPLLAAPFGATAQKSWDVGLMLGTTYYTGDLNTWGHFKGGTMHRGYGLVFRRNLNPRWSMKFTGLYGDISGDDRLYDNHFQVNRDLHFRSHIYEGAAMMEFNFFRYVASDTKAYFTPVVFIGAGLFHFNPQARRGDSATWEDLQWQKTEGQDKEYARVQPVMPFGVGMRMKFSHRLLVQAEWGHRKTFTDYLDDVSTVYPGQNYVSGGSATTSGYQRGNSQNQDWYHFAGATMSYRFGHKPGTCEFEHTSKRKKKRVAKRKKRKRKSQEKKGTRAVQD